MRRHDFFSAWQRWKKGTTQIQMEVGPLRVEKGRSICPDRILEIMGHEGYEDPFLFEDFVTFSGANICWYFTACRKV